MQTKAIIFDFGFTLFKFKEPSVEKFFECFNRGLLKSVDLLKKMKVFQEETIAKQFIKAFNEKKNEYFKLSVKTKKEFTTSYFPGGVKLNEMRRCCKKCTKSNRTRL